MVKVRKFQTFGTKEGNAYFLRQLRKEEEATRVKKLKYGSLEYTKYARTPRKGEDDRPKINWQGS